MSRQCWIEVSTEYDGKVISGAYIVDGNAVTVRTVLGRRRAPLSGLTPVHLAKILLRKLDREGMA